MHEDDFIETIAKGNLDAFFADLRSEAALTDLGKSVRAVRQEQETDHAWTALTEDWELGRAGGPAPRLRSERRDIDAGEPIWRPGDDPDLGLEPLEKDSAPLHKRFTHTPQKGVPNSIVKGANGWTNEYGPTGELLRAYAASVNPEVFEPTEA